MRQQPLLDTAQRVSDGEDVDWRAVGTGVSDPTDRELIRQLEVISRIAATHRSLQAAVVGAAEPSLETTATAVRTRWGHLELIELVGSGSFGSVYRAFDTSLHREVALKLYRADIAAASVIDEGRKLAKVRHPNIVTVYGADVHGDRPGMWMEFVHGRRLDEWGRLHGQLGHGEAAFVGTELLRALAAIHAAGLVHRDIKAQNVVRESGGRIVLMDFGASHRVQGSLPDSPTGTAGTPLYMAPEIFAGAAATARTDLYSVAVLLFYLMTGRFPIEGRGLSEVRANCLAGRIHRLLDLRPDTPRWFAEAINRALATDPVARFASAGEFEAALAGEPIVPTRPAPAAATGAVGRQRPWAMGVAAIALLVVVGLAIGPLIRSQPASDATTAIAVLPIVNGTHNPEYDYLSTGMTELLIANLARIRILRVPSFDAVRALPPGLRSDADTASRLGVRLLLAGSLDEVNGQFRVVVRLTEPSSGRTVWGDEITRDRSGILAAQTEIARLLATRLTLDLNQDEQRALADRTVVPEAQDAYARGLVESTLTFDDKRAAAATSLFRQAIELDPGFAEAWAELAMMEHRLADLSPEVERADRINQARDLALKSLSLDPTLPSGLTALATVQFYFDWDFPGAERTFREALESSPSYGPARQRLAMLLAAQGRLTEAIAMGLDARAREPVVPIRSTSVGTLYYYARDFARAEAEMKRALAVSPNYAVAHLGLGRIYSAVNQPDAAIREIELALAQSRNINWVAELARTYAQAGRREDAQRVLVEVDRRQRAGEDPGADTLGYIAAAEGRVGDALQILNAAVDRHLTNVLWIRVDPRVDPLRADPRFEDLLRRAGLDAR